MQQQQRRWTQKKVKTAENNGEDSSRSQLVVGHKKTPSKKASYQLIMIITRRLEQ